MYSGRASSRAARRADFAPASDSVQLLRYNSLCPKESANKIAYRLDAEAMRTVIQSGSHDLVRLRASRPRPRRVTLAPTSEGSTLATSTPGWRTTSETSRRSLPRSQARLAWSPSFGSRCATPRERHIALAQGSTLSPQLESYRNHYCPRLAPLIRNPALPESLRAELLEVVRSLAHARALLSTPPSRPCPPRGHAVAAPVGD